MHSPQRASPKAASAAASRSPQTLQRANWIGFMDSMQEGQTGSREIEKREDWQIRQSEGNKAARRLFTAAPTIRGACGFPFGMLSPILLKTGLLWNPCAQTRS